MLPLSRKGKRSGVLTNFAEVLSIAHRPMVKRQNMSGGAPPTHKVYLADGAHPCLNEPLHFFLMGSIALWIYKCFGTLGEGAVLHFEEEPPYFISRARARTIEMSGAAFLSHQLPTTKKQPTIQWIGIEVETVAKKDKKKREKEIRENNKYTISMGLYKSF